MPHLDVLAVRDGDTVVLGERVADAVMHGVALLDAERHGDALPEAHTDADGDLLGETLTLPADEGVGDNDALAVDLPVTTVGVIQTLGDGDAVPHTELLPVREVVAVALGDDDTLPDR